ncbi:uncharacterized protein H6S33_006483 [Morchella sextelata]|uniref:uncharacterized protein n=1 Tax=Morchella sextelata TaxID=1174677 RepID=UPI001D048059|nr:uncharacterized protein H6S33_006483 [Morchella sextelata]KAH0604815.1 hypothetical protein H6S33_006483 [Morchella sextelata]
MGEPVPFTAPAAFPIDALQLLQHASLSAVLTAALGLLVAGVFASYLLILLVAHTPRPVTPNEKFYKTVTRTGTVTQPRALPDVFVPDSKPTLTVSVVVPAYNESERIPEMLAEAVDHLYAAHGNSWEILIVDDGSTDGTAKVALDWAGERMASKHDVEEDQVRVCVLDKNRGKGGAVTHGMKYVRGEYAIFADADGASRFADLAALLRDVKKVEVKGYGIAVGSRAHMVTTDAVVKRSFIRNFLMHSFHTLIRTFGIRHIRDTQCGFKLLSRAALKAVFPYMHTEGWIFDIEMLILAMYKGIPVAEVPITWHEVGGSKVRLVQDSLRMAWDLGVVRAGYWWGVYKVGEGGVRV